MTTVKKPSRPAIAPATSLPSLHPAVHVHGRAPDRVPSLVHLGVERVASLFSQLPDLGKLPAKLRAKVISRISTDVPINVAVQWVHEQEYWKKRTTTRWRNCDVAVSGGDWKRLYLERNLAEYLESIRSGGTEALTEARVVMEMSCQHVERLVISTLPSHLDLEELFFGLPRLKVLVLTYGSPGQGMAYDRSAFGIQRGDATCLGNAVSRTKVLTTLVLQNNRIDDDLCRLLCAGLVENDSVTTLDMGHNGIGDLGAKALGKVLSRPVSVLTKLVLCDNKIFEEGARALGKALRKNHTLTDLNLRLNRLGGEGGASLFDSLITNNTIVTLSVAANALEGHCAVSLGNFLRANTSLKSLDVSSNEFGEQGGNAILTALRDNTTLVNIELRGSQCGSTERQILDTRTPLQAATQNQLF